MLKIKCDVCENELQELGALVFSPPKNNLVIKKHLCVFCFERLQTLLDVNWSEK